MHIAAVLIMCNNNRHRFRFLSRTKKLADKLNNEQKFFGYKEDEGIKQNT